MNTRYRNRRSRAGLLLAAMALVGSALLVAACGGPAGAQRNQGVNGNGTAASGGNPSTKNTASRGTGKPDPKQTVFPVSVVRSVKGDIADYIAVAGGVEPLRQVDVYADMAGQLVELKVRLGQFVDRDEIVAEVDPSRPGQNYVPSPVRAPIAGTITSLPADVGSRIVQGMPVVQISTVGQLEIRTEVAERYIGAVRLGERALIELEPYPGALFPAHVAELSPVVDPSTRTMEVTIELDERDARVKAGMFAEIKIITERKTGVVKVPVEALVMRGERTYLFVAGEGDTVSRREVSVGINIDGKVEIRSGLAAGELVVARGQTLLEDGAKIKVIEELPALPAADSLL